MGAGPPLLFDSGWTTHLQRQLQLFSFGDFVRRRAEHFTVIRYDNPGCGLSDRDADLALDLVGALVDLGDRRAAASPHS